MNAILLVDPYPVVTYGLSKILQEAEIHHPVVRAHTIEQAQQAMTQKLALMVLDPALPNTTPDMFVTQVRRKHPELPILFFSSQRFGIHLILAQTLGVNGYLDKSSDSPTLSAAIRMVLSGMQCYPRLDSYSHKNNAALHKLSSRELMVLQLLRQGLRNKDIAERLFLSPKTVSTHKRNLLRKLGTAEIVMQVLDDDALQIGHVNATDDAAPQE